MSKWNCRPYAVSRCISYIWSQTFLTKFLTRVLWNLLNILKIKFSKKTFLEVWYRFLKKMENILITFLGNYLQIFKKWLFEGFWTKIKISFKINQKKIIFEFFTSFLCTFILLALSSPWSSKSKNDVIGVSYIWFNRFWATDYFEV